VAAIDDACSAAYGDIVRLARRFTHTDADARDLAQDALMAALDRGFADWASPVRRPWLCGVLRKRAAFVARTDSRRARRERVAFAAAGDGPPTLTWCPSFLATLPPSLRVVATFASADLCAAEMRWLLQLTPAALRSRLSALRRAVYAESEPPTQPRGEPQHSLGPRRAVLLAGLKSTKLPMVATHDPDGHAIFFRVVAHETVGDGNR
jgi:DNA-directed RNA polymerase specialized sigma24 family protein